MAQPLCRWGILGTANIARKNWQAIRYSGNSTLTAVASRDANRARKFINECEAVAPLSTAVAACGGYEELLQRGDVDAVYIPLPTGVRKEWVLRAAAAGKHVICEKPCGVTSDDLRAMLDACRKNRVQFMDGVMFMHSARLALLNQVLGDGQSVGPVRRVTSQFSFKGTDDFLSRNIRASSELEPLGCLGDLGWYNIRFSLCVLNQRLPQRVTGRILSQYDRGDGRTVPIEFTGELLYPDGVSASYYCSFVTENQQWAIVSGTKGYLHVPDFVLPFFGSEAAFEVNTPVFRVHGCDCNMESHPRRFAVHEYSNSMPETQEANMVRAFARIVLSGQLEPRWGELALKTQQIVDACLLSARAHGNVVELSA
jgi:predicted dehydrogenase